MLSRKERMKNRNTLLCCLLISTFAFSVLGCQNKNSGGDDTPKEVEIPEVTDDLEILDGVKFDYDKAFFDDFSQGVDYNNWIISEDCWGSNKGGLTVKNLFFTDEGTLLFRATGNYYSGDEIRGYGQVKDGRCTGASLVSKFITGPGRYQVRMKPFPRLGACTAFWTYSNRPVAGAENDNHEIDIELPGGMHHGIHSFKYMMNTNYVTEKYMDNSDFKIADVTGNKIINLNDGNFHTFGFDWYTNPEVIVYNVDGIVTCVSEIFVPYLLTRMWLGVWISYSDAFMGPPNYEADFMEVDWVKYVPFDNTQPYTVCDVDQVSISTPRENYPTVPTSRPEVNKIANGDFEYFIRKGKQNNYGWEYEKFLTDQSPVEEVCYVSATDGKDGTAGAVVKKGGYLHTTVDAAYEGYQYDISFDGKSDGTDSVMEVVYYSSYTPDTNPIKSDFVQIHNGDWENYTKTITCPEGCSCITVEFYNNSTKSTTSMAIDNVKMSRSN